LLAGVNLRRLQHLRGGDQAAPRQVDLVASINEAIKTIERETTGSNRRIIFRPGRERVIVSGPADTDDFFTKELIQNAVMFSPPYSEIRISLTTEGKSAALFVDDDGAGFQEFTAEGALHPFNRGKEEARSEKIYCRLGIGLTSLDLIAKRSGWRLEFAEGKHGKRPLLIFP
jgi:light-regulated signal transduction histidine kinase (bacteriophytochrome)